MRIYVIPENAKHLAFDTVKQLRSLPKGSSREMQAKVDAAVSELSKSKAIPATENVLVPGRSYGTVEFSATVPVWQNGKHSLRRGLPYICVQTYQADGTFLAKNAYRGITITTVKENQLYIELDSADANMSSKAAYRKSRPYRQALLELLTQHGISSADSSSVADSIIDLINPMKWKAPSPINADVPVPFLDGLPHPDREPSQAETTLVAVSMLRERACENEQYDNYFSIRMEKAAVEEADANGTLSYLVEGELRKRIRSKLASDAGWSIVKEACLDFNWGDFTMLSDEFCESLGVFSIATLTTHTCIVKVNQDELLAPIAVSVILNHHYKNESGEIQECSHDALLDMTDGSIRCDGFIEDTCSGDHVFIMFENGDTVDCDPEENFLRLLGAN